MSRKVFTAGEVLAAADVNSFLMDQTVMSFAGTAARGSAIGTAVEGMVTFLEDSNLLSIYEGGAWKTSLASTGTVLQVVQGTTSTTVNTSSGTFQDTTLTATITPKSQNSRILVLVNQNGLSKSAEATNNAIDLVIVYPDSTTTLFARFLGFTNSLLTGYTASSGAGLYTHNSLSALTFKTQFRSSFGTSSVVVNSDTAVSMITLMEIAN